MIWKRTSTPTSRCGPRAPRGPVRLAVPAVLISLICATALAGGASPASAAGADPCVFDWLCLPGQTPAPTTTAPAPGPSTAPSTPAGSAPIATAPVTGGGTGTGSGSTGSGGTTVALGGTTADSCKTDAFPAKTATSNAAKLDYAVAMGTCQKAVSSGDATVKVAAADATATPLLSSHLTHLAASKLSMDGLAYGGLTTLQTTAGPIQAMTFTASKVTIENMDESYPFTGGKVSIQNPNSTAVLQGNVTLYATKFYSKIFGLVPITFTPDFQPPLVLPSMFFTEVDTDAAYITCDQILLPKLNLPVSKG